MWWDNLRVSLAIWGAVLILGAADADSRAVAGEPSPPALDTSDRQFVSQIARRTYEQYIDDGSTYVSPYTPASLAPVDCCVVVTLRHRGRPLGVGSSGPGAVVDTTIEATLAALRDAGEKKPPPSSVRSGSVLIEIEATGSEEPIHVAGIELGPGLIERFIEPGIDGFSVHVGQAVIRLCPSELVTKNLEPSDALRQMLQQLGRVSEAVTLSRFRSVHWIQPAAGAPIVTLRRGMVLVDPGDVSPTSVAEAIDRLAEQLRYRQRPSGLFAYEFEPAVDAYSDRDEPVHHAGAAWALATHASWSKSAASDESAWRAIEVFRARTQPLAGIEGASYVTSADGKHKLGLTAQVCLAMQRHRRAERLEPDRAGLTAGMLWLQRSTGAFVTAFPPARRLDPSFLNDSVALLALCEEYRRRPDPRILDAFNAAQRAYGAALNERPTLRFAAGLCTPFARMAVVTNRREFARLAYRFADWLIPRQLTPANNPWPELHGGVATRVDAMPDITTALCVSAWVEAMLAARRFGDTERVVAYERAAERAVRFVLQLQVREVESYNLPLMRDVVGAVRNSPTDHRLRLENLQYAILALMSYRDAVVPGP